MLASLIAVFGSVAGAADVTFVECAAEVGLVGSHAPSWDSYSTMSSGGAVADFNNDGWQDLYYVSGGETPDFLFINNGDGTFTDKAEEAGVSRPHRGHSAAAGDYDNDGWVDIFVTSLGPEDLWISMPGYHLLYHNNGDGTFTDKAEEAGANFSAPLDPEGMGASFGDYDLDGDLDLFIASWRPNIGGNVLLKNDGDGTFSDATEAAGLYADGIWGFTPRFIDMDGDRYPELLLTADFGTSRYYRNDLDGTFTDITKASGTGLDDNGMGCTIGDFNNDGMFDWFVTSVFSFIGANDPIHPTPGTGNMLYLNRGGHRFEEISKKAGVNRGGWGWGTVSIDVDHDGFLDIVGTNGFMINNNDGNQEWIKDKSYIFKNNGDLTFTHAAAEFGFDHASEGRGMVNLDVDNDGDQDIVIFNRKERITFFRNEMNGENTRWLRVFLDTTKSTGVAPNGIGTRVIATVAGKSQYRYIDGGPGFLSTSELSAHFGFRNAALIDELRIEWPNGELTILEDVKTNQTVTVEYR